MDYLSKRKLQAVPHEELVLLCLQEREALEDEQAKNSSLQAKIRKLQARLDQVEEELQELAHDNHRPLAQSNGHLKDAASASQDELGSDSEAQSDSDQAPPGFSQRPAPSRNGHSEPSAGHAAFPRPLAPPLPASLQGRLSFPNGLAPRSEPSGAGGPPPGFGAPVPPKQGPASPLRGLPLYRPQRPIEAPQLPAAGAPGRSSADRWTHDHFNNPPRPPAWPQAEPPSRAPAPSIPPPPPPSQPQQPHHSHPSPSGSTQPEPGAAPHPPSGPQQAGSAPPPEHLSARLNGWGTSDQGARPGPRPDSRQASPQPGSNMSWADQADQDLGHALSSDLAFPALGQPAAASRQNGGQNGGQNGAGPQQARQASGGPEAPAGVWGKAQHLRALGEGSAPPRPAAVSVGAQGEQRIAEELAVGLRVQGDSASDLDRRREMRIKKDFELWAEYRGRPVNFMQGLELYEGLLSPQEQNQMIQHCLQWKEAGHQGLMRGRTFSAPKKSMRGKGRITVQFGCCYNYATDRQGRLPGIIPEEVVEPLPNVLKSLVRRIMHWGIVNPDIEPDTAIVNFYDTDDCIPPHIDHEDFVRPFVTISLLSEQSIMFGNRLIPLDAGEFGGGAIKTIPLPPGSCLVLKGNGADIAKHCVPAVTKPRISITLRKMGNTHAIKVIQEAHRAEKFSSWQ